MSVSTFKLNPKLAVFLLPSPFALQFVVKGIVAMSIALYITILLDFDRPYWSLISAVFLQIKPESGQVIEKGLCQLVGNIIGGGIGLLVMAFYVQSPPLALASLAFMVFVFSTLSSMTSNFNITYLYAMITVVMILVVMISITSDVTSLHTFEVAVQRVSEIGIGAVCATVSSVLLWPQHVQKQIGAHADDIIDKALSSMALYLNPQDLHKERHESLLAVIDAVMLLEADANPVVYEGPTGLGRARAAHLLSQRTLSLIAEMQVLGHFIREHPDWLAPPLVAMFGRVREVVEVLRETEDEHERRRQLNEYRRELKALDLSALQTALQHRAVQAVFEVIQLLIVMFESARAVKDAKTTKLKAEPISRYYDVLSSVTIGLRSALMFSAGTLLWVSTGWSIAFLTMVMPVVFSIMFASKPTAPMLAALLQGVVVAIPVSLIVNGLVLPIASSNYEIFLMVFCAPLTIGLIGFTNLATLLPSLGFCLTYIINTMPGNHMTFDIAGAFERSLALLIGVGALYFLFLLFKNPDGLIMRRRLISATASDLAALSLDSKDNAEAWLNGRMIVRIQRLASYETGVAGQRNLIEQGLLALNLGHAIIKQAHRLALTNDNPRLRVVVRRWQQSLARAYQASAWGINDDKRFLQLSRTIYQLMRHSPNVDETRLKRFEGLCYRIAISLRRNAGVSDDQIAQLENNMLQRADDSPEPEMGDGSNDYYSMDNQVGRPLSGQQDEPKSLDDPDQDSHDKGSDDQSGSHNDSDNDRR